MGIINLTPDSFYTGDKYRNTNDVLRHAEKMLKEGAFFLDLGAVSSRPGAIDVSEEEEFKRLLPVIIRLLKEFPGVLISVDTTRSNVAKEAASIGAAMINDISGGTFDPLMLKTVAECRLPYVAMHIKGKPSDMQINPVYEDVTGEVLAFLSHRINQAHHAGICDVIIDPGFGFGKTMEHNFTLLLQLDRFLYAGCLLMVGVSRKSMINKLLGTTPNTALNGTTSVHTLALLKGADILRVHDVKEAMQTIDIISQFKSEKFS